MTPYEAMLLGLLQGLTEFLPVSSSGHLALGQAAWGIQTGNITFEVIVHFGTLLAIVTALRTRIRNLVIGCLRRDSASWHTIYLLIIGSIPAGVIGILFKDILKEAFASPIAVCGFLIATGCILWSTRFARGNRIKITFLDAILIGFAQALAVLPGISRSGSTIGMGLWRGLDGREAATFSFLLSIPIILGATALEVGDLLAHPPHIDALWPLLLGTLVAYASGVFAIRWLLGLLSGGHFAQFAYYCWLIGLIGIAYFGG